MVARALWSPSRVKTALQCGRRLQASIEGWERKDHIRGIRGRAVHSAVETWEESERTRSLVDLVVEAWWDILDEADVAPEPILKPVLALWETEAEIGREERHALDNLHGEYKNPRATKEYKTAVAHLEPVRAEILEQRVEIEGIIAGIDLPWDTDKGLLVEGLDHSLETTRKGTEYLAELWPTPDVIGAEWDLEVDLGNGYRIHGYIDRVEGSDGVDVTDYKSSKYQDSPLDHFIQVATYGVAAEAHMGFPPDRVRLLYLRGQESDVYEYRPEWKERLADLVAAADRVLAAEAFSPTFAGCGICSYRHFCEAEFALVPIVEEVAE